MQIQTVKLMSISNMIKDIPGWKEAIEESTKFVKDQYNKSLSPKDHRETFPCDFQEASMILGKALELLLISKNVKYGKGNILNAIDFGMDVKQGLGLRMNDKFERLKNGLKGVDLGKEGFIDTFGDLVGYSAIGIMLEMDWYKLPVSDE